MNHIERIGLVLGLGALAACGGGTTSNNYGNNGNNQNPPTQPGGTPVLAASVDVQDVGSSSGAFSPNSVLLAVGGTVTWTWTGNNGHSVTSDGSPSFSPEAPVSFPPKTLVVTFPSTGDYRYFCSVHGVAGYSGSGQMTGAIYVR